MASVTTQKPRDPPRRPRVAFMWAQLGAYHVDRCAALGKHLSESFEVEVIELAQSSQEYAWAPTAAVPSVSHRVLFPGAVLESIGWWRRFTAVVRATWRADWVFSGIPASNAEVILLSFVRALVGRRMVMMTDSKLDDFPRRVHFEALKALLYLPYRAALVSGQRSEAFMRFLGFRRRPIVQGYDSVGVDRILRQSGGRLAHQADDFAARPFVFIARWVRKKNLPTLLRAYAQYRKNAGASARRLVLAGAGEEAEAVARLIDELDLADWIDRPGFLGPNEVATTLGRAIALILPSVEEQWGLIVNEAVACGVPSIVSANVGAADLLVENLVTGYVVPALSVDALAAAMLETGADEARWRTMASAVAERRPLADVMHTVEAVADLIGRRDGRAPEKPSKEFAE